MQYAICIFFFGRGIHYVVIAMEMAAAILKKQSFDSDADGQHHFDAKESEGNIGSDSLSHTNETLDFQMTDENSDPEDHFD